MKSKKIDEVQELLIQLTSFESEYYKNRTILGFSLPEEITEPERTQLEVKMPFLEKRINELRTELNSITTIV